jgi:NAD(P)-dependent dehydrogenase (short-subunit alcohol dehydrogenase family)
VEADIRDAEGKALEARYLSQLLYVHCDVTQETDLLTALDAASSTFGGLDALFNNAGAAVTVRSSQRVFHPTLAICR